MSLSSPSFLQCNSVCIGQSQMMPTANVFALNRIKYIDVSWAGEHATRKYNLLDFYDSARRCVVGLGILRNGRERNGIEDGTKSGVRCS